MMYAVGIFVVVILILILLWIVWGGCGQDYSQRKLAGLTTETWGGCNGGYYGWGIIFVIFIIILIAIFAGRAGYGYGEAEM